MVNNELTHWGIRGMRWGVRRYQNKDGSLTAAGKKRRGIEDSGNDDNESVEAKRARILKSTNASEIYKNRSLLTTAEINERLTRIDAERRLSEAAARDAKTKKTAIDRVNTALKYGSKLNDIYNFTQTPVMKALKKKLFGEAAKNYSMPLDKIWKIKDTLSNEELSKAVKRSNLEKTIKEALDEAAKANAKVKKNSDQKTSTDDTSKTDQNKTEASSDKSSHKNTKPKVEVFGEGTSKYDFKAQNDDIIIDVDNFVSDTKFSTAKNTSYYQLGQSRVTALLEDKSRYFE